MPLTQVTGAGQDVGRSCILVSIAGKNVMLDCGMHMGFNDDVSPECRCPEGGSISQLLLVVIGNTIPGSWSERASGQQ
uniref:Uncharacterized protein n=1 Tax=Spermophilus dauricus TaxID=99837 RepID=A0A8C9UKW3_SPEDA